jgi:hypothetical protein
VEDLANFAHLVEAVRPWLPHIVIVGGWAHRLHRCHPLAMTLGYQPLRTRDVDLAFSPRAPLVGDLKKALTKAGFSEELSGQSTPPVTHYTLGKEELGFYAEFLTVLQGDGRRRDGQRDLTMAKAGITAQKLRYLEVLLIAPWSIRLTSTTEIPTNQPIDLLVPNAVSFMIQKFLIHDRRDVRKRAQDVLYIHDTLQLFGASLENLRSVWEDEVRPNMPARTVKTAMRIANELFENVTDVIRESSRIPQDRTLQPENIRAAIQYGLTEVFNPA